MNLRSVVLSADFKPVFRLSCRNKSRLPMLRVLFGRSGRSDTLDTHKLSVVGVHKVVDCIGRACNPFATIVISATRYACTIDIRSKSDNRFKSDFVLYFAVNVNALITRFTNRRIVSTHCIGNIEYHLRNGRIIDKVREFYFCLVREVCKFRACNPICTLNQNVLPRNGNGLAVAFLICGLEIANLQDFVINQILIEFVFRRVVVRHAFLRYFRHPKVRRSIFNYPNSVPAFKLISRIAVQCRDCVFGGHKADRSRFCVRFHYRFVRLPDSVICLVNCTVRVVLGGLRGGLCFVCRGDCTVSRCDSIVCQSCGVVRCGLCGFCGLLSRVCR